jgi:hypothetical protein
MSGDDPQRPHHPLPPRAGVGLKPEHIRAILETGPDIGWFEIHAENYMGEGGPPHHDLSAIRARYPVSLHGVGLRKRAARPGPSRPSQGAHLSLSAFALLRASCVVEP